MAFHSSDRQDRSIKICPSTWILDEKEEAKLKHRRRLLQERACRIHQPRITSIAVDVDAIEKQVKEKELRQNVEKQKEAEHQKLASHLQTLSLHTENNIRKECEAQRRELELFWKEKQNKDLQKTQLDMEITDMSSTDGLRFVGEDEGRKEREFAQKIQTRNFLLDQLKEAKRMRGAEMAHERENSTFEEMMRSRAQRIDEAEISCRKAEEKAIHRMNEELANTKQQQNQIFEKAEKKATEDHIHHFVNSTLLTEDHRAARSLLGPHRVLCDRWKGLTDKEKKRYQTDLRQQIQQNIIRQREVERSDFEYEKQREVLDQKGLNYQLKLEKLKREEAAKIAKENSSLAQQQKLQKERNEEERNTNFIEEDFFNKFAIYPR